VDVASLEKVLTITYRKSNGDVAGTWNLFKRKKVTPGIAPAVPPADKDKKEKEDQDKVEYFVLTELTRVPGKVGRMSAERVEQDIPQFFGGPAPKGAAKPPGTPAAKPGAMTPRPTPAAPKAAPSKPSQPPGQTAPKGAPAGAKQT